MASQSNCPLVAQQLIRYMFLLGKYVCILIIFVHVMNIVLDLQQYSLCMVNFVVCHVNVCVIKFFIIMYLVPCTPYTFISPKLLIGKPASLSVLICPTCLNWHIFSSWFVSFEQLNDTHHCKHDEVALINMCVQGKWNKCCKLTSATYLLAYPLDWSRCAFLFTKFFVHDFHNFFQNSKLVKVCLSICYFGVATFILNPVYLSNVLMHMQICFI